MLINKQHGGSANCVFIFPFDSINKTAQVTDFPALCLMSAAAEATRLCLLRVFPSARQFSTICFY